MIQTESPELDDVAGAESVTVVITKVPCGKCFTTMFSAADGEVVRQDQHVIVDRGLIAGGVINL
jgi:hypothetical protein